MLSGGEKLTYELRFLVAIVPLILFGISYYADYQRGEKLLRLKRSVWTSLFRKSKTTTYRKSLLIIKRLFKYRKNILNALLSGVFFFYFIQGTSFVEPADLGSIIGMVCYNRVHRTVCMSSFDSKWLIWRESG
jgi:hypothetical protein